MFRSWNFQERIKNLEDALSERKEATIRQDKIIQMLKNQVKMYQTVSGDHSMGSRKRMLADTLDVSIGGVLCSESKFRLLPLNFFGFSL